MHRMWSLSRRKWWILPGGFPRIFLVNAIVAAHDIGALGYLDDHQLVDLAGLITPEVIPFMLDEEHSG